MKVKLCHSAVDQLHPVTIGLKGTLETRPILPDSNRPCLCVVLIIKHQANLPCLTRGAINIHKYLILSLAVDHGQGRFYALPLIICSGIPLLDQRPRGHQRISKFHIVLLMVKDLRPIQIGVRGILVPINRPLLPRHCRSLFLPKSSCNIFSYCIVNQSTTTPVLSLCLPWIPFP